MTNCRMTLNEPPNFSGLWFCRLPNVEVGWRGGSCKMLLLIIQHREKRSTFAAQSVVSCNFLVLSFMSVIKRKMNFYKQIMGSVLLYCIILPRWQTAMIWQLNEIKKHRETSSKCDWFLNQTSFAMTFSGKAVSELCSPVHLWKSCEVTQGRGLEIEKDYWTGVRELSSSLCPVNPHAA